jgi:N-acetylneuraminate synthase
MPAYKVASADLTNHDLLERLGKTGKPLICSTGMSTEHEIREAIQILRHLGSAYLLLHCNSTYPAPFKDINLRYLAQLQKIGDCLVGYSGHERGGNVAIAAVALGAKVVEKHITLDREMKGNDHKVSLLPDEFCAMVEGIRQVERALGCSEERQLTQGEMINRVSLAKSLVSTCDLNPGDIIQMDTVEVKSPGQGLQPNRKKKLIGARINRKMLKGDFFYPSDLATKVINARKYKFDRPWGIPVRFHDYKELLNKSNPTLLEFHLSYKDMGIEINKCFDRVYDIDFIVHSPELFSGEHILDLCSSDTAYRNKSIRELQKVVDLTRSLKPYFKKAKRPLIITNIGGFSFNSLLPKSESISLYHILVESLKQLDTNGVEIIPQTMPPFPWHFGGQRFHNLFVNPWEIADWCQNNPYRICLDVSHSALACNQFHWSFMQFVEIVGPFTAHLHVADAAGEDGEGLQIGSGHIDFPALADNLKLKAPGASFIPEIWQGHENGGEGFWEALDKLEKYL